MADLINPVKLFVQEYTPLVLWGLGGIWVAQKVTGVLGGVIGAINRKRMLSRWSNTPKDVVILHGFPEGVTCPNISPFVLKLETYLRMAKIPYELDKTDPMSVKGKCPWITLNGEHVADSQLCVEYLAKKFGKTIGHYSKDQQALGTMARLMMDEHFYWGLLLWRYVYANGSDYCRIFDHYPRLLLTLVHRFMLCGMLKAACVAQGVGRHSKDDAIEIMCSDLRTLSTFLGEKPFLLGDEPCEDDAAVFGALAQVVWCAPGSPFEKLVHEELTNLKDYCYRMKTTFWPDWEDRLSSKREKKNN